MKSARSLTLCMLLLNAAAVNGQDAWRQYATPSEAGFSEPQLDAVRALADSVRSGALMIVFRGHVLAAYGDVSREFQAHSIRKSLLSALYGSASADGKIALTTTLAELGIDDDSVLTAQEKTATVRDLISARSGIYLPAAYAPSNQDVRPARGAHVRGSHWFYNNWDFNVAGVAFEKLTGERWYEAFERRIASKVGMEDWSAADGYAVYEPTASRHPAHTLRISTRDLARFGQLYLQQGQWRGQQVLPHSWVTESTRMHSKFEAGDGYGYMWWIYPAGSLDEGRYPLLHKLNVVQARGSGGHALFIVPDAELVVVHRADTDHGRSVADSATWRMVEQVLAAKQTAPKQSPRLVGLTSVRLQSQLPAPTLAYAPLPSALIKEITGEYEAEPGAPRARIFEWQGQPYIFIPRQGSAELFMIDGEALTIRVQPGIRITFDRNERGAVSALRFTRVGGRAVVARRYDPK